MGIEAIILAMKPEFAEAIFAGQKRFELRRRKPHISHGTVVYVYATSPEQAILGHFECADIHEGRPKDLWAQFGAFLSISRDGFRDYFQGAEVGYGLEVERVTRWREPFSLAAIRRIVPRFWPPRFYRRISPREPLMRSLSRRSQAVGVSYLARRP